MAFRKPAGSGGVHARSFGTEVPPDDARVCCSAGILPAGSGRPPDGGRDAHQTAAGTGTTKCEGSGVWTLRTLHAVGEARPFVRSK